MIILIGINIAFILISMLIIIRSIYKYGKLLSDISILYFLIIKFLPSLLSITNVIFLIILHPHFVYIGLYPMLITVSYYLAEYLKFYKINKKYKESLFAKKYIVKISSNYNLNISYNDIRLRIRPNKRIDFIINLYEPHNYYILEKALKEVKKSINSDPNFMNHKVNFFIEEKKRIKHTHNLIKI